MGILSDIFGGVKVSSSVYEAADETNLFSGLMDSIIDMAQTIDANAYKNAVRQKNAGAAAEMGGIVSADYEANKGPLTYSGSKSYQNAAALATESIQVANNIESDAERQNLASNVNMAAGDLKKVSTNVQGTLKNLASIEGVDMAREQYEFTKDSSNAAIGQAFVGGMVGGLTKQMAKNYQDTGSFNKTQVMQDGQLGTIPFFGSGGFEAYGTKPTNTSKTVTT